MQWSTLYFQSLAVHLYSKAAFYITDTSTYKGRKNRSMFQLILYPLCIQT